MNEVLRPTAYLPCPELRTTSLTLNVRVGAISVWVLLSLKEQNGRYWVERFTNDLTRIINHYSSENIRLRNLRKIVISIDPGNNDRELLAEALRHFSIGWSMKTKFTKNGQRIKIYLY